MADDDGPDSPSQTAVAIARQAIELHRETLHREHEGQAVPDALLGSCFIDLTNLNLVKLPIGLINEIRDNVSNLKLDHNQLSSPTALSPRIIELSKLRYLSLRHNALSDFPRELLDLPNLEVLDLKDNGLLSLPEDLSRLSRLKKLAVRDNKIAAFPKCIASMHSLSVLSASGNPVTFPPPDKWLVDSASPNGDSSFSIVDQQSTVRLKKLLLEHAKGERLRIDTDSERQSESNTESTPRPARRQASGRFPIRPSTSSIDISAMTAPGSPRVATKPQPLPLSKHTRVPTGPRSAVLRPGITPLATSNSERNRSNSESQTFTTIRERRRGIVPPKAGSDQARLDSQKLHRLSHARVISFPSNLQNGVSANGATDESSPPSPVDTEPARGAFVSRLSSLPEKKRKSQFYDPRVELAHGVDFVLCQLRFPLDHLKNTVKDAASRGRLFERAYHGVYTHLDELRRQLQNAEIDSEDAEESEHTEVLNRIYDSCQLCLHGFEQLLETLQRQVAQIVKQANASYVRSLMLLLYGGMIELRNASTKHNLEQQPPAAHEPFKLSNESNALRLESPHYSPRHSRAYSRNLSNDSSQDRPLTSLRVRDRSSRHSNRKSPNVRPKPLALHGRGLSGSLASLNGFPGRGYEAYNPNHFNEPPGLSRSTTLASADFDDITDDTIFLDVCQKLTIACDNATAALPRCETDLNKCRRRGLSNHEAGVLDDVSNKCGQTLRSARALKNRLASVQRSPSRYRESPDFWHLCLRLISAQAAFVQALKSSIHAGLVPSGVKTGVRPVHESIKIAGAAISSSPWRHYTSASSRKGSTVATVESSYASPPLTAINSAGAITIPQPIWSKENTSMGIAAQPLPNPLTMKALPSLGLNTKAYVSAPTVGEPQSAASSTGGAPGPQSGPVTPLPATPLTASLGPAAAATVPTVAKTLPGLPGALGSTASNGPVASSPNLQGMVKYATGEGASTVRQVQRSASATRKPGWTSVNL